MKCKDCKQCQNPDGAIALVYPNLKICSLTEYPINREKDCKQIILQLKEKRDKMTLDLKRISEEIRTMRTYFLNEVYEVGE